MEAQHSSSDIFATLPQTIIESILCLLPTEEAARTSILSRDWRYKWTTIPKLVLTQSRYEPKGTGRIYISARDNLKWGSKFLCVIYPVLLLRQSPIHEFSLSMKACCTSTEMDQIILHLSKHHTIKKLTLCLTTTSLPLSLFSLHQLTDLHLRGCVINHEPMFNGFGNLTSLSLMCVTISAESFLHLLSGCPSLKIFKCWLKLAKDPASFKAPTIMELFERLPVVEHLTFRDCFIWDVGLASVPQELPRLLIHLKYLCLKYVSVPMSREWPFLATLIKCSPNLEKIKLEIVDRYDDWDASKEYPDVRMEHLNELEIDNFIFRNCLQQMEFVKFVMMRSPNLKKVILDTCLNDKYKELEMLKILSHAPKASPVEIIVKNRCIGRQCFFCCNFLK